MAGRSGKNIKLTNFTMPNNMSSIKYALKSAPGFADAGVPHGDGDGPRAPPRCLGGVWKKFQMTNFISPNKIFNIVRHLTIFSKISPWPC